MPSFAELLQQGAANAWLFTPSAILLGALHGLEPGHSKTLMAAFIVAVRGTIFQAILLGLAATVSHTLIVWGIALTGMYLWQGVDAERVEPYFQLLSAIIIIAVASWMAWATWREQQRVKAARAAAAAYDADTAKGGLSRRIDTGHGYMGLEIPAGEGPVKWRLKVLSGDEWKGEYVTLAIERPNGTRQGFTFVDRDGYMESAEAVAGPYDFKARMSLDHGDHVHDYDVAFGKAGKKDDLGLGDESLMDAHERAHAEDIRKRFAGRNVTTWQIVLFGITGGLIPCPAAITVLLLCLQVKKFVLGAWLVLCFSIGLAITLVSVGIIAALSIAKMSQRSSWFSTFAARAPYVSSALIFLVGLYVAYHGWSGIRALQTAML